MFSINLWFRLQLRFRFRSWIELGWASTVATLGFGHHWVVVAQLPIRAQIWSTQLGSLAFTDGFDVHARSSTIFHPRKRGGTLDFGYSEGALLGWSRWLHVRKDDSKREELKEVVEFVRAPSLLGLYEGTGDRRKLIWQVKKATIAAEIEGVKGELQRIDE
jgi:hypothetical protein